MSTTFSKRLHPATAMLPLAPAPTYQRTHNTRTTRSSFESEATHTGSISTQEFFYKEGLEQAPKESSKTKKAWEKFKKMAKEHHTSVNAAYQVYYGAGTYPLERKPEARSEEVREK